jgi:hypothetical protein
MTSLVLCDTARFFQSSLLKDMFGVGEDHSVRWRYENDRVLVFAASPLSSLHCFHRALSMGDTVILVVDANIVWMDRRLFKAWFLSFRLLKKRIGRVCLSNVSRVACVRSLIEKEMWQNGLLYNKPWSANDHLSFPKEFRDSVFTFLLVNKRMWRLCRDLRLLIVATLARVEFALDFIEVPSVDSLKRAVASTRTSTMVPHVGLAKDLMFGVCSVLRVRGVGLVLCGIVISGCVKVGDNVIWRGGQKPIDVAVCSIECNHIRTLEAVEGQIVGLLVKPLHRVHEFFLGFVHSSQSSNVNLIVCSIEFVFCCSVKPSRSFMLYCGGCHVRVKVKEVRGREMSLLVQQETFCALEGLTFIGMDCYRPIVSGKIVSIRDFS